MVTKLVMTREISYSLILKKKWTIFGLWSNFKQLTLIMEKKKNGTNLEKIHRLQVPLLIDLLISNNFSLTFFLHNALRVFYELSVVKVWSIITVD